MERGKLSEDLGYASREYNAYKMKEAARRKRTRHIFLLLPLFMSMFFILAARFFSDGSIYSHSVPRDLLFFSSLGSAVIFIFAVSITYLQGGFKDVVSVAVGLIQLSAERKDSIGKQESKDFDPLLQKIDSLTEDITLLKNAQKAAADKDVADIKERIAGEVIHELSESAVISRGYDAILKKIDTEFESSIKRLSDEVTALGLRGNVNLALGVVTTIVGLSILTMFVWKMPDVALEPIPFILLFMPRVSLVIFIQVFSFFFLRLYRTGLSEIKYFQNEITNLELKYLALRTSLMGSTEDSLSEVVRVLIGSERNRFLEKGQTTQEIEKYKFDQAVNGELIKLIPKLLDRK